MKRAIAVGMLAVTFFATLLAACDSKVQNEPETKWTPLTLEARRKLKIPDDATHCRFGHARVVDPNGVIGTVPILWYVREADAADFASQPPDYKFEIVKSYSSMPTPPPPPFVIDRKDRFTNTVTGSTIEVDYSNETGQVGQKDFKATLNMYKFSAASAKPLWGQGAATPVGTTGSSGTVVMFLRPDAAPCKHSYYHGSPSKTCRRVLIEYFDYADAASVRDLPQTSGAGQNIFPVGHAKCSGGEQETSDGDGHEGPP